MMTWNGEGLSVSNVDIVADIRVGGLDTAAVNDNNWSQGQYVQDEHASSATESIYYNHATLVRP